MKITAKRIKPGEFGKAEMPHSEVCMHMRVAGKTMKFQLLDKQYPSVQLYKDDDTFFSGPITTGEAGVFTDDQGYYYYPSEEE